MNPQELSTNPERWITYGFRASGISPTMIDATKPLFDFQFVDKVTEPSLMAETRSTESIRETASKVATETGIEGSYLAFSAAAKISTEHMNNNNVKKFRLDRKMLAYKYKLTLTNPYPHQMLTQTALNFLRQESPARIVEQYGEFYAKEMRLGGIFQLTNVAEMSSSDTKSSVEWDVRASYSAGFSVSAYSQGSVNRSEYKKNTEISTKWVVKGGQTTIWFGLARDDSNLEDIQRRWADSLSDDNLYPVWKRLAPLWKVLEDVDSNKARQLETYLKEKWEREGRSIVDGQPSPDLRLYCVGHENNRYYAYISQSGRAVPDWAGRNRFCFQTFYDSRGPSGTSTYCQGKNDGWYSHLTQSRNLPSWAWRDHFCFDAYPEGRAPAGMDLYCNGWENNRYYTYLAHGRGVPSWAGRGRFCFHAYAEAY